MPANPLTPSHARFAVRLLALYFLVDGLWQLLANLFASWAEFDPSYLGFYFRSQALGPLLGIGLGAALFLLSGRLGRCLLGKQAE